MSDLSDRESVRFELAPTTNVGLYEPELTRLLTLIAEVMGEENPAEWAEHCCLVTDESWVGDFFPREFKGQKVYRRRDYGSFAELRAAAKADRQARIAAGDQSEQDDRLTVLSAKLGIPVERSTPLVEVCGIMRSLSSA